MPHGEMLRTKIKKEIIASIPTAVAVEEAKQIIKDKREKKKSALDHLQEYLLAKIKEIDPLELIAVGGMTVVIQPSVLAAQQFTEFVNKNATLAGGIWSFTDPAKVILALEEVLGRVITGNVDKTNLPTLKIIVMSWVIALVLSIIIVKSAKSFSGALANINLQTMLTGLLLV